MPRPHPSHVPAEIVAVIPVTPQGPPPGRKFPCAKCGAKLDFDPSSQALKCPYCGHSEEIAPDSHAPEEHDYAEYLRRLAGEQAALAGHTSQVTCTGCGAVVLLEDTVATDKCPFCATHLESKPTAAQGMILPEGILPFVIADREARHAFNRWIESRWFAPSELRQLANLGQLSGVYVPFWTYDSMTYTHYTGQRGDNYQKTEYYTETDAQGNQVSRSRTVTKTSWTSVSGKVQHFFDDVLICGSNSLSHGESGELGPWDLKNLEGFQPHFLSGFKTERYAIGLEEGFVKAREFMDARIRQLCCRHIGGDQQTLSSVKTQHVGVTFKHLLMPAWLGAYRYRDQPYRILVNARTGKVTGSRPYSVAKIVLMIVAILLALALFLGVMALAGAFGAAAVRQGSVAPSKPERQMTEILPLAWCPGLEPYGAMSKQRPLGSLHCRPVAMTIGGTD